MIEILGQYFQANCFGQSPLAPIKGNKARRLKFQGECHVQDIERATLNVSSVTPRKLQNLARIDFLLNWAGSQQPGTARRLDRRQSFA
jgi:hypothetical protein